MHDQNNKGQQPAQGTQQPVNNGSQQNVRDERDEKIKNEPDTARIRSERQSVIDGEGKGSENA